MRRLASEPSTISCTARCRGGIHSKALGYPRWRDEFITVLSADASPRAAARIRRHQYRGADLSWNRHIRAALSPEDRYDSLVIRSGVVRVYRHVCLAEWRLGLCAPSSAATRIGSRVLPRSSIKTKTHRNDDDRICDRSFDKRGLHRNRVSRWTLRRRLGDRSIDRARR